MGLGHLIVEASTARGNIVIRDALVQVTGTELKEPITALTGFNGHTEPIPLPTLDRAETLSPTDPAPYFSYRVSVNKQGYNPVTIEEVRIFDGHTAYLPITLIPLDYDLQRAREERGEDIPVATAPVQTNNVASPRGNVVRLPVIPTNISVHLGAPGSDAPTVNVPFVYYIKNVASSEIYPTWPEEALKANIYAILSLTLNRVYTEWYRQRGYDYEITNNTAFDHKYTPNGQIYDSISNIVDEIFNEYIVKQDHIEPLFAAYCDGKVVPDCVGLKQWGTVDLANEGMNALEILRHYYGDDIHLTETNRIEDITDSYPGRALRLGSGGHDVYTMQRYLNRIAINYPSIPRVRPENGIFDTRMEEAVKEFQRNFRMEPDGVIGKGTWYKIASIYNSVRKLSELGEEGERLPSQDLRFRRVLKEGDRGEDVDILQYMLNVFAEFYSTIPTVLIDSRFGKTTTNAVKAYQRTFGLDEDGIVGRYTWNHMVEKTNYLLSQIPLRDELVQYPGHPLKLGDESENIRVMQGYLNEISYHYPGIPRSIADGVFDQETEDQVIAFQKKFMPNADGVVGPATWNKMLDVYVRTLEVVPYPGFEMQMGDRNLYVSAMQAYLNDIAAYYPSVPYVAVDETFGPNTQESVIAFQKQFGLQPDGVVGKTTWNKILEVFLNTPELLSASAIMDKAIEASARGSASRDRW